MLYTINNSTVKQIKVCKNYKFNETKDEKIQILKVLIIFGILVSTAISLAKHSSLIQISLIIIPFAIRSFSIYRENVEHKARIEQIKQLFLNEKTYHAHDIFNELEHESKGRGEEPKIRVLLNDHMKNRHLG